MDLYLVIKSFKKLLYSSTRPDAETNKNTFIDNIKTNSRAKLDFTFLEHGLSDFERYEHYEMERKVSVSKQVIQVSSLTQPLCRLSL